MALAADLDADGDSDLLLVTAAGLRLLRNDGGNAGGQLKVRLVGTKTNPSGIGTHVEVRAGEFRAVRSVSSLPVEIGLGGRRQLDSVQTVWTNGVVENQIQVTVAARAPDDRGEERRDRLVPVPVRLGRRALPLRHRPPGELAAGAVRCGAARSSPADPDELVWVGDSRKPRPRDGHYVLQVTDELREVLYLDEARLVAVDHAPRSRGAPDRPADAAPVSPSELWPLRSPRVPERPSATTASTAPGRWRHRRRLRTAGSPLPPPLRGKTHPLALTLDFGPLADLHAPVLALTGWLQYGDASTNIAMSQNRAWRSSPPPSTWRPRTGRGSRWT